jgi:hypothetical protein
MTERTPPTQQAARAVLTQPTTLGGLENRSIRARIESMDISLVGIGRYGVTSQNGGEYTVDVLDRGCTCLDWIQSEPHGGCKHMGRVNLEILAGFVPRPDGRLPASIISDGGQTKPSRTERTDERRESEARIEGPFWERDRYGEYTGVTYYRCQGCDTEALRRADLDAQPCCDR